MSPFFERLKRETGIHFSIDQGFDGRGNPCTGIRGFKRINGIPHSNRVVAEGLLLSTAERIGFLRLGTEALVDWFKSKERAHAEETQTDRLPGSHDPAPDTETIAPVPSLRGPGLLADELPPALDLPGLSSPRDPDWYTLGGA